MHDPSNPPKGSSRGSKGRARSCLREATTVVRQLSDGQWADTLSVFSTCLRVPSSRLRVRCVCLCLPCLFYFNTLDMAAHNNRSEAATMTCRGHDLNPSFWQRGLLTKRQAVAAAECIT